VNEIFEGKYHRRVFFAATALTFLALVLARYFSTPPPGEQASLLVQTTLAVIDNVTSGLFASIVVGATIYFFAPRRDNPALITQLESREIVPNFDIALKEATGWIFRGNRGRYLRAKVLPTLASRQGTFTVEAILTNPGNIDACRKFAEHKSVKLAQDEPGVWDTERVQAEILAAITICCWYTRFTSLSISLFLSESFSPIRFDSNLQTSFVTVENKRESCLRFRTGHFFHEWLQDDFAVAKRQATAVKLPTITRDALMNITVDDILVVARAIGLSANDPSLLKKAKAIVNTNADPFR
jgi:hypothetical protein